MRGANTYFQRVYRARETPMPYQLSFHSTGHPPLPLQLLVVHGTHFTNAWIHYYDLYTNSQSSLISDLGYKGRVDHYLL